MNTKVKVGIAAAIVAALVALIVLDQKTTPKDDTASKPGTGGENTITVVGTGTNAGHPVIFTAVGLHGPAGVGTFSLILSDGYSISGTLLSGSIQLQ